MSWGVLEIKYVAQTSGESPELGGATGDGCKRVAVYNEESACWRAKGAKGAKGEPNAARTR